MKDQNDDNFSDEFADDSNTPDATPPEENNLDDFDQNDLSEFDDIHEEYEESDEHEPVTDEELNEDEAYANLDESSTAKNINKNTNIVSLIKENWLYALLGLVVIIVAAYLIMGMFSSPADRPAAAAAPAASQTAFNKLPADQQTTTATATATNTGSTTEQTNAAPATGITATTAGTTAAQPTISMSAEQMQQLLQGFSNTVQQSMKTVQETIQSSGSPATNEKLGALQDQLTALNGNISTLNSNLNTADTRLNTTQQQLSQVLAQETANQQKLTLRAVVPGRAWLVDGKGNTISVTVGSSLGYIGTVTEIDSDQDNSQVVTSSGYIFK